MADPAALDVQKRAAARAAVAEVQAHMVVGLGTGSTAAYAIAALGERVAEGLPVRAVATSDRTAAAAGIDVLDLAAFASIDLCIDGVDEIDPAFRAIKGAGGAMLREKIVASAATRMIAVADSTKPVRQLGRRPVPVEILPLAVGFVQRRLVDLGGSPTLRLGAAGQPWRTDQANLVLDCGFGLIDDPARLALLLSGIAGVLGHGLFVEEIDALYVGTATGVDRRDRSMQQ